MTACSRNTVELRSMSVHFASIPPSIHVLPKYMYNCLSTGDGDLRVTSHCLFFFKTPIRFMTWNHFFWVVFQVPIRNGPAYLLPLSSSETAGLVSFLGAGYCLHPHTRVWVQSLKPMGWGNSLVRREGLLYSHITFYHQKKYCYNGMCLKQNGSLYGSLKWLHFSLISKEGFGSTYIW